MLKNLSYSLILVASRCPSWCSQNKAQDPAVGWALHPQLTYHFASHVLTHGLDRKLQTTTFPRNFSCNKSNKFWLKTYLLHSVQTSSKPILHSEILPWHLDWSSFSYSWRGHRLMESPQCQNQSYWDQISQC